MNLQGVSRPEFTREPRARGHAKFLEKPKTPYPGNESDGEPTNSSSNEATLQARSSTTGSKPKGRFGEPKTKPSTKPLKSPSRLTLFRLWVSARKRKETGYEKKKATASACGIVCAAKARQPFAAAPNAPITHRFLRGEAKLRGTGY
jgi:hypothetical protein